MRIFSFKFLNFLSLALFFITIIFYISHNTKIFYLKRNIKKIKNEILNLEEENRALEAEFFYSKDLEKLELEMKENGFRNIEKEDIFYLN